MSTPRVDDAPLDYLSGRSTQLVDLYASALAQEQQQTAASPASAERPYSAPANGRRRKRPEIVVDPPPQPAAAAPHSPQERGCLFFLHHLLCCGGGESRSAAAASAAASPSSLPTARRLRSGGASDAGRADVDAAGTTAVPSAADDTPRGASLRPPLPQILVNQVNNSNSNSNSGSNSGTAVAQSSERVSSILDAASFKPRGEVAALYARSPESSAKPATAGNAASPSGRGGRHPSPPLEAGAPHARSPIITPLSAQIPRPIYETLVANSAAQSPQSSFIEHNEGDGPSSPRSHTSPLLQQLVAGDNRHEAGTEASLLLSLKHRDTESRPGAPSPVLVLPSRTASATASSTPSSVPLSSTASSLASTNRSSAGKGSGSGSIVTFSHSTGSPSFPSSTSSSSLQPSPLPGHFVPALLPLSDRLLAPPPDRGSVMEPEPHTELHDVGDFEETDAQQQAASLASMMARVASGAKLPPSTTPVSPLQRTNSSSTSSFSSVATPPSSSAGAVQPLDAASPASRIVIRLSGGASFSRSPRSQVAPEFVPIVVADGSDGRHSPERNSSRSGNMYHDSAVITSSPLSPRRQQRAGAQSRRSTAPNGLPLHHHTSSISSHNGMVSSGPLSPQQPINLSGAGGSSGSLSSLDSGSTTPISLRTESVSKRNLISVKNSSASFNRSGV